jgi:hypothetical protein
MSAYGIRDGAVTKLAGATFDEVRDLVGGYVQPAYSADGRTILWCNEDGQPLGLTPNSVATALWWHVNPAAKPQRLVGPVVVTGGDPDNLGPVPADVAAILDDWRNS